MPTDAALTESRRAAPGGRPVAHPAVYRWTVRSAVVLTIALPLLALIGWIASGAATAAWLRMTPLSAVGYLLGGIALGTIVRNVPGRRGRIVARGFAAGAAIIGVVTLAEYAFGIDLGVDRLLFPEGVLAVGGRFPGRPAVSAGIAFVASGIALALLSGGDRQRVAAAQNVVLATLFAGVLSLVGRAYGTAQLYALGPYTPMSISASIASVTLALGVLFHRPARGFVAVFTADDFGGYVARRLLPAAFLIPFLLGWVGVIAERAGWLGPITGITAAIVATMAAFLVLGAWIALAVRRLDAQRRAGETARARLAAIVESSEDGINASDLDGTITAWNRSAERIYGYTAEEVVGRSIDIVFPPERKGELGTILDRLRRGERVEHFETSRVRKDGRRIDISLSVSPVRDARGRIVGSSAIVRDITDKKRAEAERERLLERERTAHHEAERARAEAERRARAEAALRNATEAVTATFTVDEVIRRIAESAIAATDADGAFVQRIAPDVREVRVVAASGRHTLPLGAAFPLRGSATERVVGRREPESVPAARHRPENVPDELDRHCPECAVAVVPLVEAGEAIGSLAVVRGPERAPFTDDEIARARTFGRLASLAFRKVHLLEDTERRRRELQRVLESRGRLMRGFSHDVKNPLSAAEGRLAMLEEGLLDRLGRRQREGVSRVRRSIRAAVRLIDSLVELGRAEAGRIRLEEAPADVRPVAREVAEEYRASADARNITLRAELADTLPIIRSDSDRIRQILGNLLSNAVKYTPPGGHIVARVAERSGPAAPGPGRWIAVDVADTGPGIPEDKREAVFGEFTRLEPGEGRGAGLGLAISRRLARLLGGEITLESEVGVGSTFTLWLPEERRAAARPRAGEPGGERVWRHERVGAARAGRGDGGEGGGGRSGRRAADGADHARDGGPADRDGGTADDDDGAAPPLGRWEPDDWLHLFLDHLEDYAVFTLDTGGRIHCWNRGAERTTGFPADRVIGRPFSIFYPREEAESGKPEREMRLALERGKYQEERWRLKADGTRFFAREILVPLRDGDGRHIGFGKVLQDLTGRRRAEEALRESERRFRATFEQAAVGIAHVAPDGHWIRVNERLAEITGYSRDELEGKTFQDITHPDDLEADLTLAARLLAGEIERYTMEKRYIRKDGSIVWIELTVALVRDDRGNPEYFISVIEDISRRKRAEAELVRAKEEAERASRAKSDFLAVMSHELRTPLTAVVGYAEVLEAEVEGPITPGQRRQLERIKASARHLVDLIEEILSFSRLESGREELHLTTADLATLARETTDVVEPTAREAGLAFHVELPDSPVVADTDPPKVRRILLDLLANAIKFTPEGEVALTMDATERSVVVRVRDTGIGIPPEDLGRIFEPFWQAQAALTREVGGTGLGLTVARRLARMLGGDVTVESEVGVGSTFTVELPRRPCGPGRPG